MELGWVSGLSQYQQHEPIQFNPNSCHRTVAVSTGKNRHENGVSGYPRYGYLHLLKLYSMAWLAHGLLLTHVLYIGVTLDLTPLRSIIGILGTFGAVVDNFFMVLVLF